MSDTNYEIPLRETIQSPWGQRLEPLYSPDGKRVIQFIEELEGRPGDDTAESFAGETTAAQYGSDNTTSSTTSLSTEESRGPGVYHNKCASAPPTTNEPPLSAPRRDGCRWVICAWPSAGGVIVQLGGPRCERIRDPYINAEHAYYRKLMVLGARYIDEENRVWVCRQEDRFGYWDVSTPKRPINIAFID